MKKIIVMTLIGVLVLLGAARPVPTPYKALFCPECWD